MKKKRGSGGYAAAVALGATMTGWLMGLAGAVRVRMKATPKNYDGDAFPTSEVRQRAARYRDVAERVATLAAEAGLPFRNVGTYACDWLLVSLVDRSSPPADVAQNYIAVLRIRHRVGLSVPDGDALRYASPLNSPAGGGL